MTAAQLIKWIKNYNDFTENNLLHAHTHMYTSYPPHHTHFWFQHDVKNI